MTLRAKWNAFVGTHRAHFNPDGRFAVCSDHFSPDSFERLKKDSFPTIWKKPGKKVIGEPLSKRDRRMPDQPQEPLHINADDLNTQQLE
ncbi:hypothetical protein P5673_006059, partial [Acropora cervicornis]